MSPAVFGCLSELYESSKITFLFSGEFPHLWFSWMPLPFSTTRLISGIYMVLIGIKETAWKPLLLQSSWQSDVDTKAHPFLIISKCLCAPAFALANYNFSLCFKIGSKDFRYREFHYLEFVLPKPLNCICIIGLISKINFPPKAMDKSNIKQRHFSYFTKFF